ncbi:UvrD-helicase domain-containing protein [uncultured Parabacteroides sp.]|uniref:UvrD-helicase domain-containing protein n=1 Tax=uncultured Parabacteroides sp. TaxID=512312 RepID=UPI002805B1F4|nr:UvrD-helicase domain-containing protein [uncultured Parabacteroides sp.]
MSFATDDEIRIAHDILLKEKKPFDNPRVEIIKKDSSCYVQACPGSGKTTSLLAKLIILANKLPLADGRGVCVLTHTNVAIDEIKAKVGPKAEVLFSYPNFFGTIQTFLHKYIAGAALHYFYGSQIQYVDNDIAMAVLLKKYSSLPFENKLKGLVFARMAAKKHRLGEEEINAWGGVDLLKAANVIKQKGKRVIWYDFQLSGHVYANIPRNIVQQIRAKKKEILDNEWKDIILSFKVDWLNNQIIADQRPIGFSSESGAEYLKLKEEMFQDGILSFEDAYDLAFRYIREKGLDFCRFSDKRFKYLFIDEVQDCDKQQVKLIKSLFADDKVIVQRFGDYCQAIYDGDGGDGSDNTELRDENILYIRNSNRFGEKIARPLRFLCMEDNHLLVGNEDVYSVKPVILTYEDPLAVLPKYAELLRTTTIPEMDNISVLNLANKEKNEDPLHRVNIKACGWVGKKGANEQKIYIESYYPSFEKKNVKTRGEGDSFDDFLYKSPQGTVKDCASSIIQGVIEFLDLCDVNNDTKRYTRTSLLGYLTLIDAKDKEEFLSKVMNWVMLAATGNNAEERLHLKEDIYQYLSGTLLPLLGKNEVTVVANTFFNAVADGNQGGQNLEHGNIYKEDDMEIEIATVHAVKGETHAATLYLETFFNKYYESERLKEQFKGIAYMGTDDDTLKSLRVVYVGMSRPRYLLCVAIQKDRFHTIDCQELRDIWDVVEV